MEELANEGFVFFEDDSVTLHHSSYQKYTRQLLLQRVRVKGKQVTKKWSSVIEIKNANPNDVMELHQATCEDLVHTVED